MTQQDPPVSLSTPVIATPDDAAHAVGLWFVTASDEDRDAFVLAHRQWSRARHKTGTATTAEPPQPWQTRR